MSTATVIMKFAAQEPVTWMVFQHDIAEDITELAQITYNDFKRIMQNGAVVTTNVESAYVAADGMEDNDPTDRGFILYETCTRQFRHGSVYFPPTDYEEYA